MSAKWLAGLALLLALLIGCGGSSQGTVSGKVTYKDKPVSTGSITFRSKDKGVAQDAKLDSSGGFTMEQPLPPGTYQVAYIAPKPEPVDPSKGKAAVVSSPLPKKFEDMATSGVTVEVTAGKNDIPIAFKD